MASSSGRSPALTVLAILFIVAVVGGLLWIVVPLVPGIVDFIGDFLRNSSRN